MIFRVSRFSMVRAISVLIEVDDEAVKFFFNKRIAPNMWDGDEFDAQRVAEHVNSSWTLAEANSNFGADSVKEI